MDVLLLVFEYIGALVVPLLYFLWQLHKQINKLENQLTQLSTWKDEHTQQCLNAAQRTTDEIHRLELQIQSHTTETKEQHSVIKAQLRDAAKEGSQGRKEIHSRITTLSESIAQIIGVMQEKERGINK